MVDLVKLFIKAGQGGDGRISFHSNRYQIKGGPDGGDGGDGGNIVAVATQHQNTLRDFSGVSRLEAQDGHIGGADKMHGKTAEDTVVELPIGTRVWKITSSYLPRELKRMYKNDRDLGRVEREIERRPGGPIQEAEGVFTLSSSETEPSEMPVSAPAEKGVVSYAGYEYAVELVGDLLTPGQELVIAKGGRGGKGNEYYKSSRNTTPMEAQTGEGGESGDYFFELQLLADVGLVGFPNAGKSTLLSILTKATPKIGNYPFTTIEPNLGVLTIEAKNAKERRSIVIADIPGLIEGASDGKGLGTQFLRHISRCRGLIFLLSIDDNLLFDEAVSTKQLVKAYEDSYETLTKELQAYEKKTSSIDLKFAKKKKVLVLSKADLLEKTRKSDISATLSKKIENAFWISAVSGEGLEELKKKILLMIK